MLGVDSSTFATANYTPLALNRVLVVDECMDTCFKDRKNGLRQSLKQSRLRILAIHSPLNKI